jgi:hypothetical protein
MRSSAQILSILFFNQETAMRRVRICIYGGTDLRETPTDLISALTYKILDSMSAVIVTGGFRYLNKNPNSISTDVAALQGAQRFAAEHKTDLKDWYEAWIPEPHLDDHKDEIVTTTSTPATMARRRPSGVQIPSTSRMG